VRQAMELVFSRSSEPPMPRAPTTCTETFVARTVCALIGCSSADSRVGGRLRAGMTLARFLLAPWQQLHRAGNGIRLDQRGRADPNLPACGGK
jgi:hypothetical protein